ncbi:protein Flattop homolog isoform X2 [Asterias rubens]|uniref:protein Flattop homolog isoform X2 n=1 Tax=Asterias rubens TaxID=7604 RepID=UPI0014558890|nr:protein Flattop homolog isoform X2 [Asterias rubens]
MTSTNSTANRYEQAFDSKRLQNWQLPHTYKERPSRFDGFTQVIANDRGHLLGGVPHSSENPWGKFVGTWDIPLKIPGNVTTFMARSDPAAVGIVKGRKDHEDYMRKAAGSPVKELAKAPSPRRKSPEKTLASPRQTPPSKSPQDRPCNPSPTQGSPRPASKSPQLA